MYYIINFILWVSQSFLVCLLPFYYMQLFFNWIFVPGKTTDFLYIYLFFQAKICWPQDF